MRRISLLLAITLFSIFLVSPSYAKSKYKYIPAQQASRAHDEADVDINQGRVGLTIDDEDNEAVLVYFLSKKKIKKLTFYGDPKGGEMGVMFLLADTQTGLLYDVNGNALTQQPTIELFASGTTSLEYDLPKRGVKKDSNYSWVIIFLLQKGDENLPEFYGIRYK